MCFAFPFGKKLSVLYSSVFDFSFGSSSNNCKSVSIWFCYSQYIFGAVFDSFGRKYLWVDAFMLVFLFTRCLRRHHSMSPLNIFTRWQHAVIIREIDEIAFSFIAFNDKNYFFHSFFSFSTFSLDRFLRFRYISRFNRFSTAHWMLDVACNWQFFLFALAIVYRSHSFAHSSCMYVCTIYVCLLICLFVCLFSNLCDLLWPFPFAWPLNHVE